MNEDPQSFVTEINGSISTAAKRQHGLLKLAFFLESCQSKEQCSLLEKHSPFWIKTILQLLENHPISVHAKLAHYCFYLLIQNSRNCSPELCRMISTNFVEKSIILLLASNEQLAKNALICLNELINCYRSACSQFRQKIEIYVISQMDNNSEDVIEWSAKCYSKLAFLHKNQNSNDMWYTYFKNALKNANMILNDLFEDYQTALSFDESLQDVSMNSSMNDMNKTAQSSSGPFSLAKSDGLFYKLSKENLDVYFTKSINRFKACLLALTYSFEPLNEQVILKVKLNEIIQFLKRVYFFDIRKLLNDVQVNVESKHLCESLSDLFNSVLKFTSKLVSVSNTNLIPNSNQINQMFSHFGSNINEKILFNTIPVYFECLTHWMETLGANSGLSNYSTSLIDILLHNITPHKTNILAIETNNKMNPNKSKLNQQIDKDIYFYNNKLFLNNFQTVIRSNIIISALKCLNEFIKRFNEKFNYNTFEKIQQTIINIILSIQNNYSNQKPYDQPKCRLGLYEILYQLCLSKNNKLAPPLSISISLFRNALDDSSKEIKLYAQNSLNNLRSFTYPILPIYIKEYRVDVNQLQISQQQQSQLSQNNQHDPILNFTSNNKLPIHLENKLGFSVDNQFMNNNSKSLFNSQTTTINNNNATNNLNSENTASSLSTNDNIYANNSNSLINNNNSTQLNSAKNHNSSLNEMKNSLNLTTNQTNTNNGNATNSILKRKNMSRENSMNDESYQKGSKSYYNADKKNKTICNEDSNGNEKEIEDDMDDDEEDDDDDLIDEEDIDEEDLEEEDEEEDEVEDDDDEDDMNEESEEQISGVKKIETSDEVIRIDSEEDAEDQFDEEDENEEEFEDESESSSDKKISDCKETNKTITINCNNNNNYDSNQSNDKKSESNSNTNDNDIQSKEIVSKLLNPSDYDDDEEEETGSGDGENTNSKDSTVKTDNHKSDLNIEDKENCLLTKQIDDVSSYGKKSPIKQLDHSYNKELNNQSLNILKSPIMRGESNESEKLTNLHNENSNRTVDSTSEATHDDQTNETSNKNHDHEYYKKKFFTIEQNSAKPEQELNQTESNQNQPKQNVDVIDEPTKENSSDDSKLKEMCATFNPDAVNESLPTQENSTLANQQTIE